MNLLLFSNAGVLHEDAGRGDVSALYVPSRVYERRFPDVVLPTDRTVRSLVTEKDVAPLWRAVAGSVIVYGFLPAELADKRGGLDVYLPQDFAPADVSVLYYVIGNRVVYGVRDVSEEGRVSWLCSVLDTASGHDPVQTVVDVISNRMLSGELERMCVAHHGSQEAFTALQRALEPFDQTVVKFSSLRPSPDFQPLYSHRDRSFLMILSSLVATVCLVASVGYLGLQYSALKAEETRVVDLTQRLDALHATMKLGQIKNPQEVLAVIQRPLKQAPSLLFQGAAKVGKTYGELEKIDFTYGDAGTAAGGVMAPQSPVDPSATVVLPITVSVKEDPERQELLLDQEAQARAFAQQNPWVRSVERMPQEGHTLLTVGIQVQ